MATDINSLESACFEVNDRGRLISGNKRFCRMFGFKSEEEVMWHYVTDLYRYAKDWEDYRDCNTTSRHHFVSRMRNRKGRSFMCSIVRDIVQDTEGRIIFRNTIHRLGEKNVALTVSETVQENSSVVFLAKCAHCGEQIRVANLSETRMRMLCGKCTAKAYPEAYHISTVAAQM